MKLIIVWICLISEIFPFPTPSPTDVTNTKVCCEQNPKLIYKGHDANRGINVYIYEFLPESKQAKDKKAEDTTMKNKFQGNRNSLKGTENGENHEDTIIRPNKPASIYGKKNAHDTETSTHMPDLKFDTINSTVSAIQNDIEMYEDTGLLSNATKGLQTGMSDNRDVQKTSGHSNGDDYYGAEGSALFDIPDYNVTDTSTQGPKVDFPAKDNDFSNNLGCSESAGQCKNPPKSKEHIFVTQPTRHKDSKRRVDKPDRYANREKNTMDRTVKWNVKPTKTNKHKSQTQTDHNVNTKDISIRRSTGKMFYNSSGRRRKIGRNRHNSKYYSRSSSESRSDSSQEFDELFG